MSAYGIHLATLVGIYALMGVGYQLVFGQLGALNLAQGALFGVGAYATALLAPFLGVFALPAAVAISGLVAVLAGGPTLRLQSHYFALATLALAALINLAAVNLEGVTGGANGLVGFSARLPHGLWLLALVWVCLLAALAAQAWLFAGPLGEPVRLLREAPLAAATLGIDGGRWRLAAFAVGGALAGGAGASAAALNGVVSPDVTGFGVMVTCLTLVVVGGSRHPIGALLGAVLTLCLPELLRGFEGAWLLVYAVATLLVVLFAPEGLAALVDRRRRPAAVPVLPERLPAANGAQALTLERVSKRFGGIDALSAVSLSLRRGEIVGLIGPNGSGKTTLLNAISGLEPADGGTIRLDDIDVQRWPAHRIARAGVGRTFQNRAQSVPFARVMAARPAFLLLDEPAAGLGEGERQDLERLLRRLRESGHGVLIVDHDIELLGRVCDRLVCLDRGAVIAEGTPAAVRARPDVRASFLGATA
jgi:branched-chain amino acid transport system permease protein